MQNDPKLFKLYDGPIPTLQELMQHFEDNFHVVGNQLVPNELRPFIIDYISLL